MITPRTVLLAECVFRWRCVCNSNHESAPYRFSKCNCCQTRCVSALHVLIMISTGKNHSITSWFMTKIIHNEHMCRSTKWFLMRQVTCHLALKLVRGVAIWKLEMQFWDYLRMTGMWNNLGLSIIFSHHPTPTGRETLLPNKISL